MQRVPMFIKDCNLVLRAFSFCGWASRTIFSDGASITQKALSISAGTALNRVYTVINLFYSACFPLGLYTAATGS
jgi:hypothetical protein